mmetsp:Transcript_24608/g.38987  ORF Transcript_24608/g.38987 Transcript_24608/m.38987 type:complete len:237 (+) Transcript_24608:1920-2630(+)
MNEVPLRHRQLLQCIAENLALHIGILLRYKPLAVFASVELIDTLVVLVLLGVSPAFPKIKRTVGISVDIDVWKLVLRLLGIAIRVLLVFVLRLSVRRFVVVILMRALWIMRDNLYISILVKSRRLLRNQLLFLVHYLLNSAQQQMRLAIVYTIAFALFWRRWLLCLLMVLLLLLRLCLLRDIVGFHAIELEAQIEAMQEITVYLVEQLQERELRGIVHAKVQLIDGIRGEAISRVA